MKVPRLGRGEATLGIESFEMEQMILPTLRGGHVPRFVATGDLTAIPYIVMERIDGSRLPTPSAARRCRRKQWRRSAPRLPMRSTASMCRR
jgi:hypothetical protein